MAQPGQMPQITPDQAKCEPCVCCLFRRGSLRLYPRLPCAALLKETIETLSSADNKSKLEAAMAAAAGAENPAMARMQQVMPLIAGIMTPIISKYGFANAMQAVMVVNMTVNQPGADPALKEATAAIQGAAMGNIPDDATCQALLAKLA